MPRKPGRPRMKKGLAKDQTVIVRLRKVTCVMIDRLAHQRGVTRSQWLTDCIEAMIDFEIDNPPEMKRRK